MARLQRLALPTFALIAAVFAPSRAAAQQCTTDAECADGFACIKGWSAPGCEDPSAGCPSPEPVESELGWCERKPISCTTDADCPDFMACMDEDTPCWSSSSGDESDCIEPDPANRSCRATELTCATTADCPSSFECLSVPEPCPMYDCAPGTDCEPVDCNQTQNVCQPEQIACSTNADCPSAWSCEDVGTTDCETSPSGMGGSGPDCASPAVLACVPTGFSSTGSGKPEGTNATTSSPQSSSRSGGCAVRASRHSDSGGGLALIAAAGAALAFARRRRA
jgi:MYXO-CTERM domain-containing protein